jgi:hypothetical protein
MCCRCTSRDVCPNQSDAEWAELTPEAPRARRFRPAHRFDCRKTDEYIRTIDPHAYLHKQMIPLRMVTLDPKSDAGGLFTGGCSAGMCYGGQKPA